MKNNKLKVGNVPNLRFPEFEGEWERNTLGEICKMQAGKFVSASEIKEQAQHTLYPCYGGNGLRGYTKSYNQDGLYSLIGRQGALCGNITLASGKFHATEHAIVVSPNGGIDTLWMYYLLTHLNLNQYATGAAQPGLSVQNLEKIGVVIPNSMAEQQKNSSILNLLDERIQTQNKIIEKLKSLMSGINNMLLEEILKFDSFSESWNAYRVYDVLEFFQTNSLSWENLDYDDGTIRNIHYGMIHKHVRKSVDLSIDKLPFVKENCVPNNLILCKEGDIIFADASEDTNDVAKAIELINCDDEKIISGLHTIHGRDKLGLTIVGFKGLVFSSKYFRNQIRRLAQGTKVYSISPKNFRECSIKIPPKAEQAKIVAIVSNLEKKISVEIDYLSKLAKQKESLLKDLFI